MKITALYDSEGIILAGVVDDGRYDLPRPKPQDGQQVGTFDVPPTFAALALDEICTTFRVDTRSMGLTKL